MAGAKPIQTYFDQQISPQVNSKANSVKKGNKSDLHTPTNNTSHVQKSLHNTYKGFCIYILCIYTTPPPPPRRYPYFDIVVELEWSHDPESYAGGSVCYW
jgi:hypothetical protein